MSFKMDPEILRETAKKLAKEQIEKSGGTEQLLRSFIEGGADDNADTQQQRIKEVQEQRMMQERERMTKLLDTASTVVCESCGNHTFTQVCVMKKISALVSPNGQEMTVPLATWQCTKCDHINKEFLPDNVLSDVEKVKEEKPKRKRKTTKKS